MVGYVESRTSTQVATHKEVRRTSKRSADNKEGDKVKCPICLKTKKEENSLIMLGPLLVCCGCRAAWVEWEFLAACKAVGLAYYFEDNLNGQLVIYDPAIETHKFVEEVVK